MRRSVLATAIFILLTAGFAHADLNDFIRSVNINAEGNIGGFRTELGVHFGAPAPTVDFVLRSVDTPAEAAILFWLGQRSGRPVERVVSVYRSSKGQGWGAIAKELGIKPGSADFHALKRGDLGWRSSGGGQQEAKNQSKKKK